MNKTDLINAVAEKSELSKKDSGVAVEAVLESITESLADHEDVKLKGFGNWVIRERAARKGINPSTQEKIDIPASKGVGFKPSKSLKDIVKEG